MLDLFKNFITTNISYLDALLYKIKIFIINKFMLLMI